MKLGSILAVFLLTLSFSLQATPYDLKSIPVLEMQGVHRENFEQMSNAFPEDFDASRIVGRAKDISVDEAMVIAQESPEITYFIKVNFDLWGGELPIPPKNRVNRSKIIRAGTVLFFSGSASGWTDTYDRSLRQGRYTSDYLFDVVYIKKTK